MTTSHAAERDEQILPYLTVATLARARARKHALASRAPGRPAWTPQPANACSSVGDPTVVVVSQRHEILPALLRLRDAEVVEAV